MEENKFDFNSCLLKDEKILYQGRPTPDKGSKQVGGTLFLICFSLVFLGLLIWSLVTKTGDGAGGISIAYIVFFVLSLFFLAIGIYSLVYNLFLKKRMLSDDFYCLTNMRALKYESRKKKLVFGYLASYNNIVCENMKNNYGDLSMSIDISNEIDENNPDLLKLKDMMLNPNPENMPFIVFQSIKNPKAVREIAKNARDDVIKENNLKMVDASNDSEN